MRYHDITKDDMKNGDGLRVVLWVAGCTHHCRDCRTQSPGTQRTVQNSTKQRGRVQRSLKKLHFRPDVFRWRSALSGQSGDGNEACSARQERISGQDNLAVYRLSLGRGAQPVGFCRCRCLRGWQVCSRAEGYEAFVEGQQKPAGHRCEKDAHGRSRGRGDFTLRRL